MWYSIGTYTESQRWVELERVERRPSRIDGTMTRVARESGQDNIYARSIYGSGRLGHTTVCGCGGCP